VAVCARSSRWTTSWWTELDRAGLAGCLRRLLGRPGSFPLRVRGCLRGYGRRPVRSAVAGEGGRGADELAKQRGVALETLAVGSLLLVLRNQFLGLLEHGALPLLGLDRGGAVPLPSLRVGLLLAVFIGITTPGEPTSPRLATCATSSGRGSRVASRSATSRSTETAGSANAPFGRTRRHQRRLTGRSRY